MGLFRFWQQGTPRDHVLESLQYATEKVNKLEEELKERKYENETQSDIIFRHKSTIHNQRTMIENLRVEIQKLRIELGDA